MQVYNGGFANTNTLKYNYTEVGDVWRWNDEDEIVKEISKKG